MTDLSDANVCSVCGGEGVPLSGLKCGCDGAGTADGEMIGLRRECFRLRSDLAAALAVVEAARREITVNVPHARVCMCGMCSHMRAFDAREAERAAGEERKT